MDPARISHFIGGGFDAFVDDRLRSTNPTEPGDTVALAPMGQTADVARAVAAAEDVFPSWSALSAPARAEVLYKWAEAISARADELAVAIVREVGKPIGEARGEVGRCVAILRYYAG